MNSPAAALTWEIWRRHRARLLVMVSLWLTFALFYPKLCASMGLNLYSPNALDDIVSPFAQRAGSGPVWLKVLQVLSLLFLLLGPVACLMMSLLYIIWIFTFAEIDSQKGFAFPTRLFTLPISTRFLVSWLLAAGLMALSVVWLAWTRVVHLPHLDLFDGYSDWLTWVTFLVVAQASVWALDAFPVARVLLLSAAVFGLGYLVGPAIHDHPFLDEHRRIILLSVLLLSGAVACAGLDQIRHGGWQRWTLGVQTVSEIRRLLARLWSSKKGAPRAFRSPAHAQFWFEWRRAGAKLFFCVCALSGVPLLIMAAVAVRAGPLSEDETFSLSLYLLLVPLFIHFIHGIVPERTVPAFVATHPVTNGELVIAKLRTVTLSAVLSWMVTLALLSVVPLLGNVPAVIEHSPSFVQNQLLAWPLLPVLLLGLMFLTWRFVAADLCFGLAGYSWVPKMMVFKTYAVMALIVALLHLGKDAGFQNRLFEFLPFVLGLLVALKCVLALWAFRISLKRQLLARSAALKYVAVWTILAAAFLIPVLAVFHTEKWILSLALGIILLLPLARIGFSPIALGFGRHR